MKKGTTEKNNDSKKKQHYSNLREYGFAHVKVINIKTYYREITDGHPLKNTLH